MFGFKLETIFLYKKTILVFFILFTLLFAYSAKNIQSDFNFNPSVTDRKLSGLEEKFISDEKARFGRHDVNARSIIVIAYDKKLFSAQILNQLKNLEQQLTKIKLVSSVDSLYSIQDFSHALNSDTWRPLIVGNERTDAELTYVKYQATRNRILHTRFVNSNATAMVFYLRLEPASKKQLYETRAAVEKIIQSYRPKLQNIYQIGSVEVENYLYETCKHDAIVLGGLALLFLVIIYGVFFNRITLGILPVFISTVALIWTFGIMASFQVPINILSSVVFILVFTVGAMECAHFINFYQKSYQDKPGAEPSYHAAHTLRHIAWPIFFAAITTVLGFIFNLFASVKLLEDFAIAISLGIMINTAIICFLLPVLLEFFVPPKILPSSKKQFLPLANLIIKVHKKLISRPKLVYAAIFLIVSMGVLLSPKIPVEIISYVNFYQNSSLMKKISTTGDYSLGVRGFSVYLSSDQPEAFEQKENLEKLFQIQDQIESLPSTVSTISMASLMATARQIFMDEGDGPDEYKVPDSSRFIKAFLNSAENFSLGGMSYLTKDNQIARIYVTYRIYKTKELSNYFETVQAIVKNNLKHSALKFEMANVMLTELNAIMHVLNVQLISIFVIYLSIFLVMWWIFKTYKAGLVAIIPNFFPLAGTVMVMYLLSIPFFPVTIIVLAAILGLAVDNTIHIMLSFKKFYQEFGDIDQAISRAIFAQMRPVTITTASLVIAVAMLGLSSLKSIMLFALLMIVGLFMAWISDVFITPFLLKQVNITKRL